MLTANKGEWSEIYALFKLLGQQKLYLGDADLKRIDNPFFPIIKIIRNESSGNFEYEIDREVVIISGGSELIRIPTSDFESFANKLLVAIRSSKGAFEIEEIETFMSSIKCTAIKAKSSSKTDIRIVIHDLRISQQAELGFSIKSQLGGGSTLLNAGKSTNFVFTINNVSLSVVDIAEINSIETSTNKIQNRLSAILEKGGSLEFVKLENAIFQNNLVLIDSLLPQILAEMLLAFYTSKSSAITDLVRVVKAANPNQYDTQFAHSFYEYKIKKFLTEAALGMTPAKVWTGIYDATGGYLVVKEDGDVLCYHIYHRNQFEDYLFANTKLETASSTRHEFGKIYESDGQLLISLNLQVRFK